MALQNRYGTTSYDPERNMETIPLRRPSLQQRISHRLADYRRSCAHLWPPLIYLAANTIILYFRLSVIIFMGLFILSFTPDTFGCDQYLQLPLILPAIGGFVLTFLTFEWDQFLGQNWDWVAVGGRYREIPSATMYAVHFGGFASLAITPMVAVHTQRQCLIFPAGFVGAVVQPLVYLMAYHTIWILWNVTPRLLQRCIYWAGLMSGKAGQRLINSLPVISSIFKRLATMILGSQWDRTPYHSPSPVRPIIIRPIEFLPLFVLYPVYRLVMKLQKKQEGTRW